MKHLTLWIWLKENGLKQQDLAAGLGKSVSWVSTRMRVVGFGATEQGEILKWCRKVRPGAPVSVQGCDLFESEPSGGVVGRPVEIAPSAGRSTTPPKAWRRVA